MESSSPATEMAAQGKIESLLLGWTQQHDCWTDSGLLHNYLCL